MKTKFSLTTATALVIANMVGTGVFTSLGFQIGLDKAGNPVISSGLALILLWVLGGMIALFGALTYSEAGVLFPRCGGEYHYLTEMYHPGRGLHGRLDLVHRRFRRAGRPRLDRPGHVLRQRPGPARGPRPARPSSTSSVIAVLVVAGRCRRSSRWTRSSAPGSRTSSPSSRWPSSSSSSAWASPWAGPPRLSFAPTAAAAPRHPQPGLRRLDVLRHLLLFRMERGGLRRRRDRPTVPEPPDQPDHRDALRHRHVRPPELRLPLHRAPAGALPASSKSDSSSPPRSSGPAAGG